MNLKIACYIAAMLAVYGITPKRGYANGLPTQIAISKEYKPHPTFPRTSEQVVIECFYDAVSNALHFQYLEDIGGPTVTVMNTTTGESFFDNSSTPELATSIISGESGTYSIRIEDGNGSCYTGSFFI